MAVTGRNNFASVVKFAGGVIKIPGIKEIWNSSSFQGRNEFQKLIKYNMSLAYDGDLTIKNFCTLKGLTLYIPDLSLDEDTLSFTFDVYGLIKPPLKLHMFFYMYNCKRKDSIDFLIMPKCINITPNDHGMLKKNGESKYIINRKLEEKESEFMSYFKDVVVFLAVTGTPLIENRKYWTNTVGFDIPLV